MKAIWEGLRPHQWTKNLFVFAGVLFSGELFHAESLAKAAVAFAVFCLLSGAVYLLNDLVDLQQDRNHPVKSRRPLASSRLSKVRALQAAGVLLAACGVVSRWVSPPFFLIAAAYLLLQAGYLFFFKDWVILDVFAVAAGFALRVVGGAAAVGVEASSWLVVCTIFLALFIALGKRRQELLLDAENGPKTRRVLKKYSPALLDQMIAVVTASTVIAYVLYTMSEETLARFGTRNLVYTVPFVLYGILRYLYLIHQKGVGEAPEAALTADWPLLVAGLLWAAAAVITIYG